MINCIFKSSHKEAYFFLLATGRFGPLRVLAFVFVANPLIQLFVEEKGEEYHQYMERRKQENVEIILSRLRI